jgi:AcrR family transcriptional regulator
MLKRRLPATKRRDEIVRVALDLAAQRGTDRVTTQDMANAMGLTQGAIFRHFATKDDIWLAVIDWIRGEVMERVEAAGSEGKGPLDALERMFYAHAGFIRQYPGVPRLMFSDLIHSQNPALKGRIQRILAGYETKLVALLTEAQLRGLADENLDVQGAAALFIGMVQGLAIRASILGPEQDVEAQARKVFAVFLNGVRARP